MNRPHLRWSDFDNSGDILPDGYKRLKDGTIIAYHKGMTERSQTISCNSQELVNDSQRLVNRLVKEGTDLSGGTLSIR